MLKQDIILEMLSFDLDLEHIQNLTLHLIYYYENTNYDVILPILNIKLV